MKPQCKNAVNLAAGRELSAAELAQIEDRISGTMRRLAQQDPQGWSAKPQDQRVLEAATMAMKDIQAEADLKVQRAQLQTVKTAAMESRVEVLMRELDLGRSRALAREMDQTASHIDAVKREHMARLIDLVDAAGSGDETGIGRRTLMLLFDAENPQMTADLLREVFTKANGATGNKVAQRGARAWLETIEAMRQRFNAAGGDIRKLDYGYIPQPHDQARVRGDGGLGARDAWVAKVFPLVDRARYVLEDGRFADDARVTDFLNSAWESIATDGLSQRTPGEFQGSGMRANAGSESRQIHFKDADGYLAYMAEYGRGTAYDAMLGHVGAMARDIGLVERYGPNPGNQMRVQFDLARLADQSLKRDGLVLPTSRWEVLSGAAGAPESVQMARVMQDARNVQVFGKLGSAVLSSITDLETYFSTLSYNRLPYFEAIANIGRMAVSGETRDFMTMHGIIAESMASDLNRWSGDNISNNWSGRLANSTMKLSLLNAWTDTLRRSFAMTMMGGLARMSKLDWHALTEWDRTHLTRKGFSADDWEIVRQAQPTEFRGREFLTPEAIAASGIPNARRVEVTTKLLGLITDESEYAVVNPDLTTRTIQTWGGQKAGTVTGELARSVMQFKSFPIAMLTRHWRRVLEAPVGLEGAPLLLRYELGHPAVNRLMYGGAVMVSLAGLGAIATQSKQIRDGKDPIDMTNPKFWIKAIAQGGGFGIMGDFILNDPTESPVDAASAGIKSMAGPVIGTAADVALKLGIQNVWEAAKGKPTHAGAEAAQIARSNLPLVNLWYAKTAFDHAVYHSLQENLSPGYLARMQQRAQKDWGQRYFYPPDNGNALTGTMRIPERAPDMAKALGE